MEVVQAYSSMAVAKGGANVTQTTCSTQLTLDTASPA